MGVNVTTLNGVKDGVLIASTAGVMVAAGAMAGTSEWQKALVQEWWSELK